MKEFTEVGEMKIGRGKWRYLEKTSPNANLSITNPVKIEPELNSDPHVGKLEELCHTEEIIRTIDRGKETVEEITQRNVECDGRVVSQKVASVPGEPTASIFTTEEYVLTKFW
jgi:hypothetical protein